VFDAVMAVCGLLYLRKNKIKKNIYEEKDIKKLFGLNNKLFKRC
jgi:hypothetical protein